MVYIQHHIIYYTYSGTVTGKMRFYLCGAVLPCGFTQNSSWLVYCSYTVPGMSKSSVIYPFAFSFLRLYFIPRYFLSFHGAALYLSCNIYVHIFYLMPLYIHLYTFTDCIYVYVWLWYEIILMNLDIKGISLKNAKEFHSRGFDFNNIFFLNSLLLLIFL